MTLELLTGVLAWIIDSLFSPVETIIGEELVTYELLLEAEVEVIGILLKLPVVTGVYKVCWDEIFGIVFWTFFEGDKVTWFITGVAEVEDLTVVTVLTICPA